MNLRCLLCVALVLITPALAQQSATPTATAQPPQTAQKANSQLRELQVECTPASRASELIGNHGCVAGKVFRVTIRKSGNTHLSLCPGRKCSFQAVVTKHDRGNVGDLSYLRGKVVAVQGDVTESRGGHPVIAVKEREQIRVAAGDPPPEFDAAQARPATNGKPSSFSKHNRAW